MYYTKKEKNSKGQTVYSVYWIDGTGGTPKLIRKGM